jgi:hypothetical protein
MNMSLMFPNQLGVLAADYVMEVDVELLVVWVGRQSGAYTTSWRS